MQTCNQMVSNQTQIMIMIYNCYCCCNIVIITIIICICPIHLFLLLWHSFLLTFFGFLIKFSYNLLDFFLFKLWKCHCRRCVDYLGKTYTFWQHKKHKNRSLRIENLKLIFFIATPISLPSRFFFVVTFSMSLHFTSFHFTGKNEILMPHF